MPELVDDPDPDAPRTVTGSITGPDSDAGTTGRRSLRQRRLTTPSMVMLGAVTALVAAVLLVGRDDSNFPEPAQVSDPAPSIERSFPAEPPLVASAGTSTGTPRFAGASDVLVTGQLVWDDVTRSGEFQESVVVAGGIQQRVRERTARSEMSDARLTGAVTVVDNADRFGADEMFGDVLWGTVAIENNQGTWTGTLTGTSDASADRLGVSYIELVGEGAYEGLSAILFERETGPTLDWNGVIFSGNLPPDR